MKPIDMSKCEYCGDEETALIVVGDIALCAQCEEMERTTDWDEFERCKRQRIAEENEY